MKRKIMPILLLAMLGIQCSFVAVQGWSLFKQKTEKEKAAEKAQKDKAKVLAEQKKKDEAKRKKDQEEKDKKEALKLGQIEKLYDEAITKFFLTGLDKIRKMTSGNLYTSGIIEKSGFVRQCQEIVDDLKKITPKTVLKEGSRVLSKIEKIEYAVKKYVISSQANKGIEDFLKNSSNPESLIDPAEYRYLSSIKVEDQKAALQIKSDTTYAQTNFRKVAGTHVLAICNTIYNLKILAKQIIKVNEKILDKEGELMAIDQQVQAINTGV